MDVSKMKNIVVLKNLPSNIIDEAFVILKTNKKAKIKKVMEKTENKTSYINKDNTKDYIVKEAEMVISNYLSNIENDKVIKNNNVLRIQKKYNRLKMLTLFLGATLLVSIILNSLVFN